MLNNTVIGQGHVRFGSLADITALKFNVRFTPKSGHDRWVCRNPLSLGQSFVGESFAITASKLKEPGFCRIGNSLKVCSHWATKACAGT
jgi:hypothetical protein